MKHVCIHAMLSFALLLGAVVSEATASELEVRRYIEALHPQARVRVEVGAVHLFEGMFVAASSDTIQLLVESRAVRLPIEEVTALWELVLTRRRGARIGGTVLGVTTGVFALVASIAILSSNPCSGCDNGAEAAIVALFTGFSTGAGFAVGASAGSLLLPKSLTWQKRYPYKKDWQWK